jgi:hypothetical protein
VGLVLRRLGEPLRSSFEPSAMRELLARFGFGVVRDDDLHAISRSLSADLERATKMLTHHRIVTADRRD